MSNDSIKILLVDDEPDILEILSYNLSAERYQISTASNGAEAVKKAKKQAEYLIKPLNQKIGGALYIVDKYYQGYNYDAELDEVVVVGYGSRKKTEYKPVEIEFRPIEVSTQVTIKFKID